MRDKEATKGMSLFSNVGIDEIYLKEIGIDICVANELLEQRANFYKYLYPESTMICGDITKREVKAKLIQNYKKNKCDFILATPPCQGMSVAGKMDKNDTRNKLIIQVTDLIKELQPTNCLIENVSGILKFSMTIDGKEFKIIDYITRELEPLGYFIKSKILDAADFDTPQTRKRAIILISKKKNWNFPAPKKQITVKEAIGDLPSLESGERSELKFHYAKKHNKRHVVWMKHTPTGKSALENKKHFPSKDGRKIKGYSTTYKRIDWDKPSPTITMCNGGISSQNNVHPGRELEDGTFSDARVLTPLELFRISGLPDNWDVPDFVSENLLRQVIGESFPPKFAKAVLSTMPRV